MKKAEAELQETFGQLKIEIKEREETQIQLEQQSSFLRSFLDASPTRFYRNEDKEFSGCNRAMELLTGKSEKQLVHLNLLMFTHRKPPQKSLKPMKKCSVIMCH